MENAHKFWLLKYNLFNLFNFQPINLYNLLSFPSSQGEDCPLRSVGYSTNMLPIKSRNKIGCRLRGKELRTKKVRPAPAITRSNLKSLAIIASIIIITPFILCFSFRKVIIGGKSFILLFIYLLKVKLSGTCRIFSLSFSLSSPRFEFTAPTIDVSGRRQFWSSSSRHLSLQ